LSFLENELTCSVIDFSLFSFQSPTGMTLSKNVCCLCCSSGPISAYLSLPRRGYVPGDIIPLTVEIENLSSRKIASSSISLKMVRHVFSSPELKDRVSFSDRPLSVVRPPDFYIFDFFSRTAGPILTKVGTNHP
jgi:hypothetical protein